MHVLIKFFLILNRYLIVFSSSLSLLQTMLMCAPSGPNLRIFARECYTGRNNILGKKVEVKNIRLYSGITVLTLLFLRE
jgi:hypothetical protein